MLPAVAGASADPAAAPHAYMRARLADGDGASAVALASYRHALASDPQRLEIARRSYFQAMTNGDMPLALRSAALLEQAGQLPRDGTLLRIADALVLGDWTSARKFIDEMALENNFAFLAPIMRSWVSLGEGRYAPPVVNSGDRFASLAARYLDEHVALQAFARGDDETARAAASRALTLQTADVSAMRLTFAGQWAGRKARQEALALLPERDARYAAARTDIGRGKGGGRIKPFTPRQGFARLLLRLATDISSDPGTGALAIRLARIANFAYPEGNDGHVVLASLLTQWGYPSQGRDEAEKIGASSWYGMQGRIELVDALAEMGESEKAIALARSLADMPDAEPERYVRLGRLLADKKDFNGAAAAFAAAKALFPKGKAPWPLLLSEGGALEQAGRWAEAKPILEEAVRLAPDEAVALNYLGYAQIVRRQNMAAALDLLKKASAIKPDDASITDSLGWAHFLNGDVETAVPVLERAAEAAPVDATINEHLGDALWAAGRHYEARYAWRAASLFAEGDMAERLVAKGREGMKVQYAAP